LSTSQFAHEHGDDRYAHWMPLPNLPQKDTPDGPPL
jgi:hypothetical protein